MEAKLEGRGYWILTKLRNKMLINIRYQQQKTEGCLVLAIPTLADIIYHKYRDKDDHRCPLLSHQSHGIPQDTLPHNAAASDGGIMRTT